MSARPRIGLVVPPGHGRVPSDAQRLYGKRFDFIARGVGIEAVSPEGFAPVIDRVVGLARELQAEGAQTISLMGTSISFYRGHAAADAVREAMQQATGIACTTMGHAIVRALDALGVRRVAVGTSYVDALNARLADWLAAGGITVTALQGLGIAQVGGAAGVSTEDLVALGRRVHAQAPGAEGVLLSCGGLLTLDAIALLEDALGVPVVASSPAGFWDVVRSGGWDPRSPRAGRLFRQT